MIVRWLRKWRGEKRVDRAGMVAKPVDREADIARIKILAVLARKRGYPTIGEMRKRMEVEEIDREAAKDAARSASTNHTEPLEAWRYQNKPS